MGAYRQIAPRGTPKLVAENVARWKPDLVFCHHGRAASNAQFLDYLRRHGIKTAVYLCDEPYESGETCRYSPSFDYVFSMDPDTIEAHRLSRVNRAERVWYLPPAVDTARFKPKSYDGRAKSAFFLGNANLTPRPSYLRPIEKLIAGADIRFWSSVSKSNPKWVPISRHAEVYSSCRVGLNVHRSPWITRECYASRVRARPANMKVPLGITLPTEAPSAWGTGFWNDGNLPASHVNPRFLEMAACGTLVVNDASRSELARMFPMAPQASDPDHFYELVRYYLDHIKEAEEIGQACASLISERHSYRHRAAEVLIRVGLKAWDAEDLRSCLGEPVAYLTPQLSDLQKARSSSARTGPSERWSPAFGMSSIQTSGDLSDLTSIDAPPLW